MRTFFSIPVPDALTGSLQALQLAHPKVRWVDPAHFHITLLFPGDVDPPDLEELDQLVADLRFGGFDLEIEGVGSFNDKRTARALWAGVLENGDLKDLQKRLVRVCRPLVPGLDTRRFKPHITLGYCKKLYLDETAELVGSIGRAGPFRLPVEGFELWESRQTAAGAVYRSVATYPAMDRLFENCA